MRFSWPEAKRTTTLSKRGLDFALSPCAKKKKMSNVYSSPISDDEDEYPQVTQADLDRAKFRVGLQAAPRKRRVTILLDSGLVEYFQAKAGGRGYQTLINEALRESVEREELERTLRRIIRDELEGVLPTAV
jgi:uncharacterized protein (DUF4415 family)